MFLWILWCFLVAKRLFRDFYISQYCMISAHPMPVWEQWPSVGLLNKVRQRIATLGNRAKEYVTTASDTIKELFVEKPSEYIDHMTNQEVQRIESRAERVRLSPRTYLLILLLFLAGQGMAQDGKSKAETNQIVFGVEVTPLDINRLKSNNNLVVNAGWPRFGYGIDATVAYRTSLQGLAVTSWVGYQRRWWWVQLASRQTPSPLQEIPHKWWIISMPVGVKFTTPEVDKMVFFAGGSPIVLQATVWTKARLWPDRERMPEATKWFSLGYDYYVWANMQLLASLLADDQETLRKLLEGAYLKISVGGTYSFMPLFKPFEDQEGNKVRVVPREFQISFGTTF